MRKYTFLVLTVLIFLLNIGVANGDNISVGVREGDWIEYNVTTTGTPEPGHGVVWARMEIINVRDSEISVNVTTEAPNGTISSLVMVLNLEKGQIGAWWIIPANLEIGETFYDEYIDRNIPIQGEEKLVYAGALRTITNTTTPERTKRWDKETGIFVVSNDDYPDYTIDVVASRTNMWAERILGLDPTIFYAIVSIVILASAAGIIIVALGRRNKKQNQRQQSS
jgi:hypothetical protein